VQPERQGRTSGRDFWPRDSWQFQGYATPDAALQSQFYAARQGDLRTFMSYTMGEILTIAWCTRRPGKRVFNMGRKAALLTP